MLEDEVFWSETKTRTVQRMQKLTGKNRAILVKRFEQPYGLKVYTYSSKYPLSLPERATCVRLPGVQTRVTCSSAVSKDSMMPVSSR